MWENRSINFTMVLNHEVEEKLSAIRAWDDIQKGACGTPDSRYRKIHSGGRRQNINGITIKLINTHIHMYSGTFLAAT